MKKLFLIAIFTLISFNCFAWFNSQNDDYKQAKNQYNQKVNEAEQIQFAKEHIDDLSNKIAQISATHSKEETERAFRYCSNLGYTNLLDISTCISNYFK